MRLLIVSPFLPYPPDAGGKTRLLNLLKYLYQEDLEIYFLYLNIEKPPPDGISQFQKAYPKVKFIELASSTYFLRKLMYLLLSLLGYNGLCFYKIKKRINKIIIEEKIDILQMEFSQTARFLPKTEIKTILVFHEIRHVRALRELKVVNFLFKKMVLFLKYRFFKREEEVNSGKFSWIIAVSENDGRYLLRSNNKLKIKIIPNGVDIAFFRPPTDIKRSNNLYFLGWFGNFQNKDGLNYFLDEIFPLLGRYNLKIDFTAVGKDLDKNSEEKIIKIGGRYYSYLSEDSLYKQLKNNILVVPIRYAGGTRLKILEAMAVGNPVVSTSIGAEGLDVTDGENILLADNPEKFSKAIIELIDNNSLWEKLTSNGRKLVETKYNWRDIAKSQDEIYRKLCRLS